MKVKTQPNCGPALARDMNANTDFRPKTLARVRARRPAPPRARR